MPERHLASWNAMALALANHGRGKDSLDLFNRMTRVENVVPNAITFVAGFSACNHGGLAMAAMGATASPLPSLFPTGQRHTLLKHRLHPQPRGPRRRGRQGHRRAELWVHVGDDDSDHYCWQQHVDMTTSRRASEADADHPGSEVAAVMAAATAVFHWAGDAHYAHLLLHHAQQLFDFANTYRGRYDAALQVLGLHPDHGLVNSFHAIRLLLSTEYYISTMLTYVARVSLMVTVASQPASISIDAQGMFDEMQQSDTSVAIAHTAFNSFFNTEELDRWLESCDEQGELVGVNKIHVKPQFFDVGKDCNWARGIRRTEIQLADGKNCELHRCWTDILDAISKAQHLIYITGWLTILVRDDSNSVDLLTKEGLLTTHDVEIAKGEQEIMNEVLPAESRSSRFGVAMDLADIWPCYESKPSDAQGYAIKGIPNLRNTCYRSAVLQCLLMLGKLLERILPSTWLAIQGCSRTGIAIQGYYHQFSYFIHKLFSVELV
uniref:cellulase n=1 Tax=Zea mays TaxID=4577 RepID=C0PI22_MAIZE|nr:unknown [Zea mays]